MKAKTIEQLIDQYYEEMFKQLCDEGHDFYDFVIEVRIGADGKTVRRSWRDREEMLREETK